MTVASAFLVPSSPLPYFKADNPPWSPLADAMADVGKRIAEINPDVLIFYPTTWNAVMDQLWQVRPHLEGIHVDHNWFEYGDLPYSFDTDTELADACVRTATERGVKSKGVDYDAFPIDTGTIVAMHYLNPEGKIPVVLVSNNLYHDAETTRDIAAIAVEQADEQGKKAVVVAIGELSGSFFRGDIDIETDHIVEKKEDGWNRKMLDYLESGDLSVFCASMDEYAKDAKVDYGFKHMHFLLSALNDKFSSSEVMAYAPLYGKGGAVVQMLP
jgi:2-aminophenol/2-amino-5-chlorophenol 1,6-dioxygenase alpha subunit